MGNHLSITAYQDNGRILGALAGRAEDVYNGLNPDQQSVAQQVFLRLVAPGEGTEDTRRRARYSELAALKIPRNTLQSVLDLFSKYRLLTFDRDSETREPTIEVAHEALIRGWNRLRNWLDQGRSDIRLQRLLAAAAEDWRNAGQDKSYLLTGARLAQFEEWVKISKLVLSQEEQSFLEASTAEHQRLRALESERQAHELKAGTPFSQASSDDCGHSGCGLYHWPWPDGIGLPAEPYCRARARYCTTESGRSDQPSVRYAGAAIVWSGRYRKGAFSGVASSLHRKSSGRGAEHADRRRLCAWIAPHYTN